MTSRAAFREKPNCVRKPPTDRQETRRQRSYNVQTLVEPSGFDNVGDDFVDRVARPLALAVFGERKFVAEYLDASEQRFEAHD
jgi:hypothetical protein